jgi:hypothetical protein
MNAHVNLTGHSQDRLPGTAAELLCLKQQSMQYTNRMPDLCYQTLTKTASVWLAAGSSWCGATALKMSSSRLLDVSSADTTCSTTAHKPYSHIQQ